MGLSRRAYRRRADLRQLRGQIAALEQALAGRPVAPTPLGEVASILQHVRDAVVVGDPDLRIRQWNPAAEELFGWPAAEVLGRRTFEFMPVRYPDGQDRAQVLRTLEATGQWRGEAIITRRDGEERLVEAATRLLYDQSGAQLGSVIIIHDITDRKRAAADLRASEERFRTIIETDQRRAAADLRASEERFRTIIENSQDATLLTDEESRVHYCSAAITRILGYSPAELTGRPFRELLDPADLSSDAGRRAASLRQPGDLGERIVRARHRDGGWRWLLVRRSNQLANPAIGYVVSSLHDISEQRQAEEALGRSIERLRALHEIDRAIIQAESSAAIAAAALRQLRTAIPAGRADLLLYDVGGGQGSMLAVSADQPTELGPGAQLNLGPEEWGEAWPDARAGIVEDLGAGLRSITINRRFLAEGWRSLIHAPLRARGQIIGTLNLWSSEVGAFTEPQQAVVQEVADQLAIAIQHARLFEEVSQARDHLRTLSRRLVDSQEQERRHIARELHDEIGQMLTGLKLSLELVAQRAAAETAQALEPLRVEIGTLIERVRALSLNLRPMMLDDLGLLPALQWHLGRYIAQTQIQVTLRHNGIERRFPPEVETTAYRVVQEALTNVARHARVGQASVRLLADERRLMLRVDDEGAGFLVEESLAAKQTGGLFGMLERVRLLGGELTIEAGPGEGTHVIAELPLLAGTEGAEGEGR